MGNVETEKIDIGALINEVGAEVDALIKSEQVRLETLKKSEESSKEESSKEASMEKKEESSKEESSKSMEKKEESKKEESSMKKDESSGFESPAPEASSPSPDMSQSSPDGSDQGESLESMIQSLDDSMLDELIQSAMMEKDKRSQSSQSEPSPSPDMSQSAPAPQDSPKLEMAYKKEVDDMKEKLTKSEETAKNLEVAFTSMTELFDKMINRPVQKAVTDIREIEYADKGEKDLKKSEAKKEFSETEVKEQLYKMGSDHKQLEKLNKNEREALSDFFVTKKQTPEVLKLIYK